MPPTNSRKRAAPGSAATLQTPQMAPPYNASNQVSNPEYMRWNSASEGMPYADTSSYNMNNFAGSDMSQPQFDTPVPAPSTQLARRPVNRQLVATGQRTAYDQDPWGPFGDDSVFDSQNAGGPMEDNDNIDALEEKASVAKRDAMGKRKQIPPFVQKLSSFLDDGKNTDLIRWSDRGDSFVVLDEDEFAKTLIPELFKHNNYASFVRQLNMYGFHKRVGLSDNSMKASERKNKSPSEYYNPYFKRGHPNLLWLINKPKGGMAKKKQQKNNVKDEREQIIDGESDDENIEEIYGNNIQASRALSVAPESGPLQRREVAILQNQLAEIQKQQGNITNALQRLQQNHSQLFKQSMTFQGLHDRHENSITAILTFLATVYNRSLDGQGVPQNIAQMFANGIPQNDQQHQGSVVDIGDSSNQEQPHPGSMSPHRRQQRLLMAPPKAGNGRVRTTSPPANAETPSSYATTPRPGAIEELFDTSPADTTSPQNKSVSTPVQSDIMMSLINNTNAQNTSHGSNMEFPEMLSHYENANGNTPLTHEQRNNMLNLMATTTATGANNSLVSPIPPQDSLADIRHTQAEIDALMQLQDEQTNRITDVKQALGGLSPAVNIPDMDFIDDGSYFNNGDVPDPNNANLDLDQYLDTGAFYTGSSPLGNADYDYSNFDSGMGDSHFDVGMDSHDDSRIVETLENSTAATPEDDNLEMFGNTNGVRSPTKKRRKN